MAGPFRPYDYHAGFTGLDGIADTVRGYHIWSFLDDYEWGDYGRMGVVYVDYETGMRIIKDSGYWYRDIIHKNEIEL